MYGKGSTNVQVPHMSKTYFNISGSRTAISAVFRYGGLLTMQSNLILLSVKYDLQLFIHISRTSSLLQTPFLSYIYFKVHFNLGN